MSLTPELVDLVHRKIDDPGPIPGVTYLADDDYDRMVEGLLATHPPGVDAWLFAFGSLIWKPEFEHVDGRAGIAPGWHRSFCFRIRRYRATEECPGLMMSLDRGGQCKGMLYRLPAAALRQQLHKLCRREITVKPQNTEARWITVVNEGAPVRAVAFAMNRASPAYVGRLSPEEVADALSKACGHWGSGAEYLFNTVQKLEEHGIHDRYLWKLQQLVAERIATDYCLPQQE